MKKKNSEGFSRNRSFRSFSINSLDKRRKTRGDFTHQSLDQLPVMFLRSTSIYSSTKKFFQKTVDNFKSFVSGGYQRLPKSPQCNPISPSNGVGIISTRGSKRDSEGRDNFAKISLAKGEKGSRNQDRKENKTESRGKKLQDHSNSRIVREQKSYNLLAQKLRELEMMDMNDLDHVMDIEEAIHHYSRLTCTAYREIVDKFFMEMYSELFILQASASTKSLRPRLQKMNSYS